MKINKFTSAFRILLSIEVLLYEFILTARKRYNFVYFTFHIKQEDLGKMLKFPITMGRRLQLCTGG